METNYTLYLQVLIHYLGDEKTAQDFPHGNQKKKSRAKILPAVSFLKKADSQGGCTTDIHE